MDYDIELQKKIKYNEELLNDFGVKLDEEGLSLKTIRKHLMNISFFGDDFVLAQYEETLDKSMVHVDSFMSDWFVRKAMWSNENTIKENCVSFNRFYKFLYEENKISRESYLYIKDLIKNHKAYWIENVNEYNSGSDDWFDY